MTPPVAEIIRQLIIALELGVVGANQLDRWSVFVGREPEKPDRCITVYNTAGITEGRIHQSGEIQEQYGLLIRVRGVGYPETERKAQEIAHSLDTEVYRKQVVMTDLNDDHDEHTVHSMNRQGSVVPNGVDPSNGNRELFTINYLVTFE